jgi:hypothetical protein
MMDACCHCSRGCAICEPDHSGSPKAHCIPLTARRDVKRPTARWAYPSEIAPSQHYAVAEARNSSKHWSIRSRPSQVVIAITGWLQPQSIIQL